MTYFFAVAVSVFASAAFAPLAHRLERRMVMTSIAMLLRPSVGLYGVAGLGVLTLALAPSLARQQHLTAPVWTVADRPWHVERCRAHAVAAVHVAVWVSMHLIFSMLCVLPVE